MRCRAAILQVLAAASLAGLASGCKAEHRESASSSAGPDAAALAAMAPARGAGILHTNKLRNRIAYIPPQCFTKTRDPAPGSAKNPCYACHTRSEAPNFVNDQDLQLVLSLPLPGATNPWTNLSSPPVLRVPRASDEDVLSYVRQSNYFDADGGITLARVLAKLPKEWDGNGNGRWDGFMPDVRFAFDAYGFDREPKGAPTGWRAFAYYPFVGTFFPTNGSADDVLIRLDPALRQGDDGNYDERVYTVNLAIVEALVTRSDIAIDPVDEATFGVDLDLDGRIGQASHIKFDAAKDGRGGTRMRYVGRARSLLARGEFPIAPGLFPLRTEFFHTVRYLDIGPDGVTRMSPRMKEVRYARKVKWLTYAALKEHVAREAETTTLTPDRTHGIDWLRENGVSNGQGWFFQGFIEDSDGSLRPQSIDESAFCEGCHGGIGATTDGIFSFPRKLGDAAPARGWFHWSQHDLRGLPEPKRLDGQFEYSLYLREAGAGDELRANDEVMARFFDERGDLRGNEVAALHRDIARLLLPSPARALDLNRAYRAVVVEQSFDRGRDAVLASSPNVAAAPAIGEKTGIVRAMTALRLAR